MLAFVANSQLSAKPQNLKTIVNDIRRLVSRVSRDEIELMAEEIEATEVSNNMFCFLANRVNL